MKRESTSLWAIALLPMILLLAGIASGAWKEYRAWIDTRPKWEQELAAQLTLTAALRATQNESPIAEETREQLWDQQDLRLMIIDLLNQANRDEILNRYDGTPILVPPGEDWPEAPLYRRLASQAKPLVDLLEEVTERQLSNASAESPIPHFESTALGVLRIVLVDAFYRSEFEEAHRLFTLIANQLSLLSIDVNGSLQSQTLVQHLELYQAIQESLLYDPWTEQQLEKFSQLLQHSLRLAERMEAARRHQKTQVISNAIGIYQNAIDIDGMISRKIAWSLEVDSIHIKNVLNALQSSYGLEEIRDFSDIYPTAARQGTKRKPIARGGTFSPALQTQSFNNNYSLSQTMQVAFSLAITEDMRHLTLTSLRIKRYQKREGRWPDQLSDLITKEPNSQIMTTIDGTSFTYAVISGPAASRDGEIAVIQNDDATSFENPFPGQQYWPILILHRTRGNRAVLIR